MPKLGLVQQWQQLPRSVRLGLATTFAVMSVAFAEMTISLALSNWHAGLIGGVLGVSAFFIGGLVIVRNWANLKWPLRAFGAVWTIGGTVPIFLLLRWIAERWDHIAGHAS